MIVVVVVDEEFSPSTVDAAGEPATEVVTVGSEI
jgi:hypothetical protein